MKGKIILILLCVSLVALLATNVVGVTAVAEESETGIVMQEESVLGENNCVIAPITMGDSAVNSENGKKDFLDKILSLITVAVSALGGTLVAIITLIRSIRKAVNGLKEKKTEYEKEGEEQKKLSGQLMENLENYNLILARLEKTERAIDRVTVLGEKMSETLLTITDNTPQLVKKGVSSSLREMWRTGEGMTVAENSEKGKGITLAKKEESRG